MAKGVNLSWFLGFVGAGIFFYLVFSGFTPLLKAIAPQGIIGSEQKK